MDLHVHIRRWVLWWLYVGIVCGVVAVVNIFARDVTRLEERIILGIGVWFWLLGGLVCYACDSVQIEKLPKQPRHGEPPRVEQQKEWHAASDFLLPGGRKSLLPPKY